MASKWLGCRCSKLFPMLPDNPGGSFYRGFAVAKPRSWKKIHRCQVARDKWYIYGVVATGQELGLGPIGIGGRGDEVCTIPYQDIAAVVSNCPPVDYSRMKKEKVLRELALHQQVVEQAMERFIILPMKFGTMVQDEEKVKAILRTGYQEFRAALAQMKNKVQMEVIATWDLNSVLREIAKEESKESLDRRREHYQREALDSLSECAFDLQMKPLPDDSFVLNLALLIDRERQEELDSKVEELERRFGGGLSFRLVGPLPAHSFSFIEVRTPSPEEVTRARELLGIDEEASLAEVKRAYYQQARKYHPDEAQKRLAEMKEASRLLANYCLAQLAGRGLEFGDSLCSFRPEDVDDTILISIKKGEESR